ncbi:MAG: hypothetical protein SAJ12_01660, partial [Jaaginema sp. PMC 1079.18]|nr:hypothetical protein [Jaaginema sp. PMC 1079.18]
MIASHRFSLLFPLFPLSKLEAKKSPRVYAGEYVKITQFPLSLDKFIAHCTSDRPMAAKSAQPQQEHLLIIE